MIQTIDDLEGEDIPATLLDGLDIDFNRLDKNTGATNPAVRAYFLPRNTIPSSGAEVDSEQYLFWDQARQPCLERDQKARMFRGLLSNVISAKCLDGGRDEVEGQSPGHDK